VREYHPYRFHGGSMLNPRLRSALWRGLLIFCLAPLAGCRTAPAEEGQPAGSVPPGVRATITAATGAINETFTGTGSFGVNDADGVNQPKTFSVDSRPADGSGTRSFSLWRFQGTDRTAPPVGTYPVAGPSNAQAYWPTMAAVYRTEVDGWVETYVGQSGRVTVTASSPDRFAGTFRFTAVRYYRRPMRGTGREPGMVLGTPSEVPPGQPTIEVTGSFAASPWRSPRGATPAPYDPPARPLSEPRRPGVVLTLRAEPLEVAAGDTVRFTAVARNATRDSVHVGRNCGPDMDVAVTPPGGGAPRSVLLAMVGADAGFECVGWPPLAPGDSVVQHLHWRAPPRAGLYIAVAGARNGPDLTDVSAPVRIRVR
jgi:hypothetical protein